MFSSGLSEVSSSTNEVSLESTSPRLTALVAILRKTIFAMEVQEKQRDNSPPFRIGSACLITDFVNSLILS